MQVSVETKSTTQRLVKIAVPKERIEPEIQNRLKNLARTSKVNGFRPGKVPLRVIEQKFGHQVRQEAIGILIRTTYEEAIQQQNLKPLSEPVFDLESDLEQLDSGFTFTATFDIYPELTDLDMDNLVINKPIAQITDADVDEMIQKIRMQQVTWSEVERAAINEDRVMIDFVATANGESFKGNEAKQIPIVLGTPSVFGSELDQHLLGKTANQDVEIDFTLPADYHVSALAGKQLKLATHISSVAEPILPEVNDSFAVTLLGTNDATVERLRHDIRANMETQLKYAIQFKLKQQALQLVLEKNNIEAPQSLIQVEAKRLLEITRKNQLDQRGYANPNMTEEQFLDRAKEGIRIGIVVNKLAEISQIQIDSERVREMIENVAATYENPAEVKQWYYNDPKHLREIEVAVLEEQVTEYLLNKAEVIEKQMTFNEVMSSQVEYQSQAVA